MDIIRACEESRRRCGNLSLESVLLALESVLLALTVHRHWLDSDFGNHFMFAYKDSKK